MQTILGGASGAIGRDLAKALKAYTASIKIVSRTPTKVNADDVLVSADLLKKEAVVKAIEGSEVVYLVAGLPYNLSIWQQQWPIIMRNVIDGCKQHGAKLVFFDNIYMYDASSVAHLTETSTINPPSKKGKVRAAIAQMLLEETKTGQLTALIARAADFYGPSIKNSVLIETVYKNIKKSKAATWVGNRNKIHSYTYTPDAAKATALLANTANAYEQVWHLPTSAEKLTGQQWINLFADAMQVKAKAMNVPTAMVWAMGLFNPMMKEVVEMMYQYRQDYFFDSSKFAARFPEFKTTSYADGVKEVVRADQQS